MRYDSGKEDYERVLVFGDPYMTSVLESSKFWLGDGTFKLSPKNFYQIYTLHVYVLGTAPACLYALLPNKTEKPCSRLLDALEAFAPDFMPDKVLLDFEIAPFNAFQKYHSGSMLSGALLVSSRSYVEASYRDSLGSLIPGVNPMMGPLIGNTVLQHLDMKLAQRSC